MPSGPPPTPTFQTKGIHACQNIWGFGFTQTSVQILALPNASPVTVDRAASDSGPLFMGLVAVITLEVTEEEQMS